MSNGLLDFFVLEAGEYTEQLDGALAKAAGKAPDLDVFTRNARALRGSATMARVQGIATVATGLERLGRGLRDGSLQWTPQLRGAIIAAVDDVKILVRGVRTWGTAEDQRVTARTAELDALAPAFSRRSVVTPMFAVGSGLWMAAETADVASGLRRWADQSLGVDALAETVRRIRGLRGIAGLGDLPPIKEVIDTVDEVAKSLELGSAPADTHRQLFRTAADVLREASEAVQNSKQPNTGTPAVAAFGAAASALVGSAAVDKDYVVPIASLFPDGAGDHVVSAAANPPTTPNQRFRLEVVSQAEHLRRLIADARAAGPGAVAPRAANELKSATRALQRAAESFGEATTAGVARGLIEAAGALEPRALDALDALAASLAAGSAPTPSVPVAAVPTQPRGTPSVPATPYVPMANVSRATGAIVMPAPTGASLQHALESGLSGLAKLNDTPMAEPAIVEEDEGVVPIQDLLYRGKAALARAIEVGEGIKSGDTPPDQDTLAELFDLLELATTE